MLSRSCFSYFLIALGFILFCVPVTYASEDQAAINDFWEKSTRIVGGDPVEDPSKYPWMVSLNSNYAYPDIYQGHFCGGTLIAPEWVLSAAHCVNEVFTDFDVILGTKSLVADPGNYERISVERILIHPDYNVNNNNNDIALLQLSQPSKQSPVSGLADYEKIESFDKYSTAIGWGTTEFKGEIPEELQQVSIPLVPQDVCKEAMQGYDITENMICAGAWSGGKDSCQGDSGGPLVIKQDGQEVLAGVVSFGEECALRAKPGVYTRVSKYHEWINRTVNEECLFDALEEEFPDELTVFSDNSTSETVAKKDTRYRAYPLSNSFIKTNQDKLFYFGNISDYQWSDLGQTEQWLKATDCCIMQ